MPKRWAGYLGEGEGGEIEPPSHISPIIVSKDENPILALGAAGGSRIPSSIVAVISRVIDQDQSLENAVALPRVQPTKDGVDIEFTGPNGFTLSDSTYFASLGHMVTVQRQKSAVRPRSCRHEK